MISMIWTSLGHSWYSLFKVASANSYVWCWLFSSSSCGCCCWCCFCWWYFRWSCDENWPTQTLDWSWWHTRLLLRNLLQELHPRAIFYIYLSIFDQLFRKKKLILAQLKKTRFIYRINEYMFKQIEGICITVEIIKVDYYRLLAIKRQLGCQDISTSMQVASNVV